MGVKSFIIELITTVKLIWFIGDDKNRQIPASTVIYRIHYSRIVIIAVSLSFGSLIFCLIWSLIFDFERSTFTHCHVRNYLPSISSAIGNYQPQMTVWRLCILLHMPPRLLLTYSYLKYYNDAVMQRFITLVYFIIVNDVIENFALLGLSFWGSTYYYDYHRLCFAIFWICSQFSTLNTYILNNLGRLSPLLPMEKMSLKYKRYAIYGHFVFFILAAMAFLRHNAYCEPGVYTFFAAFEFLAVVTKVAFHMTAYWDFITFWLVYDTEKKIPFIMCTEPNLR